MAELIPFKCSDKFYFFTTDGNSIPFKPNLLGLNVTSLDITYMGQNTGNIINLYAYNTLDNYFYGFTIIDSAVTVIRIDSTLNYEALGLPTGFTSVTSAASAIDKNGFWYMITSGNAYYTIDMRPESATYLKLVDPLNGYIEKTSDYSTPIISSLLPSDILVTAWTTLPDGKLYGLLSPTTSYPNNFITMDPTTGMLELIPTMPNTINDDGFLAIGSDFSGTIYAVSEVNKYFYEYTIENSLATGVLKGTLNSDYVIGGGMCLNAKIDPTIRNTALLETTDCEDQEVTTTSNSLDITIVELTLTKTAKCPYVVVGGVISYCVEIKNPSNIDLVETIFKDTLDARLFYVDESFTVDGNLATPTINGKTIEYSLDIAADTTVIICFKALVG